MFNGSAARRKSGEIILEMESSAKIPGIGIFFGATGICRAETTLFPERNQKIRQLSTWRAGHGVQATR